MQERVGWKLILISRESSWHCTTGRHWLVFVCLLTSAKRKITHILKFSIGKSENTSYWCLRSSLLLMSAVDSQELVSINYTLPCQHLNRNVINMSCLFVTGLTSGLPVDVTNLPIWSFSEIFESYYTVHDWLISISRDWAHPLVLKVLECLYWLVQYY